MIDKTLEDCTPFRMNQREIPWWENELNAQGQIETGYCFPAKTHRAMAETLVRAFTNAANYENGMYIYTLFFKGE